MSKLNDLLAAAAKPHLDGVAVGCIREFGDVTCAGPFGPANDREYQYERALVLTFATDHALRKAIHEGVVKFGPFGESPSANQPSKE